MFLPLSLPLKYMVSDPNFLCHQVARNEDLVEQIGRDIYFDLVDHEKVRSFRIQKQTPFNVFKVLQYHVRSFSDLFYLII